MLEPINRMWTKIENSKSDSDIAVFMDLMYSCEQMVKIITLGLISCLDKDPQDNRYRLLQKVVIASGIGEWTQVIDDILTGPSSFSLIEKAKDMQSELVAKVGNPSWQYGAVYSLHKCLIALDIQTEDLPTKIPGRIWFTYFSQIRNKTRGHGAISFETYSVLSKQLETSLKLFENNFKLFSYSWAYLYRGMSGKYRVSKISSNTIPFEYLKEEDSHTLHDGVYIFLEGPRYIELLDSTSDLHDFFFPNGGFGNSKYESLSYITGVKVTNDAIAFQRPASILPSSETEGFHELDAIDNCFSNIPKNQGVYINRAKLESELREKLIDDRHAIITLIGPGGIGKTSLALSVLETLCITKRYDLIVWFSARDIDLLEQGAKPVKPKVLTEKDIATEYSVLVDEKTRLIKGFDSKSFFEAELTKSKIGPTLFVMDNFETLLYPPEVFKWLDTYIRLPNKILITSRMREFKGDYPIDVKGMNKEEFTKLVNVGSASLNIQHLITQEYIDELFTESSGHPYVAKVLLGELAKAGVVTRIKRIMAQRDDMLVALFERTYDSMTPAARRVFQTLCNWRTIVPRIVIEAILSRYQNEYMNVSKAIDELYRFSLIDLIKCESDGYEFISLPLSSFEFGKKKLSVSSMKSAIEIDTSYIRMFGTTNEHEVKKGIKPKIERFFNEVSKKNLINKASFNEDYRPILIFICGNFNYAWLLLGKIHEELNEYSKAKEAIQNYISNETNEKEILRAWEKISIYCRIMKDSIGEAHSYIEMCEISEIGINKLNQCAANLLRLIDENKLKIDSTEKTIVKRMTTLLEKRIADEGDFNTGTTLAWLYIQLNDLQNAKKVTKLLLSKDKHNIQAIILAKKLFNK